LACRVLAKAKSELALSILLIDISVPHFADSTLPKKISSTSSGLISGTRSTAAAKVISQEWQEAGIYFRATFDSNAT
jgi:hypothetical protein